MKILVIQKKHIGDVLTSTIILEALKQKFPYCETHYLIYENAKAVVENNPFIDKILLLTNEIRNTKIKYFKFLFSLRKQKYDVVIDAYGKINSVFMAWFSGAKTTISFKKRYTNFFLTHTLDRSKVPNINTALTHRLFLLKPLGIEINELTPKIYLTNNEIEDAKQRLIVHKIDTNKRIVMVSVLGSEQQKSLPDSYIAEVLDIIVNHNPNIQILLNYIPRQKDHVQLIYSMCNESTKKRIFIDFFDTELRHFLATTKLCCALIGNEGGATNMAKALGIPTFSIYSPLIKKEGWNIFENGASNVSVELDDFLPNIDQDKNPNERYIHFKPDLFKDLLEKFLNYNCK